MGVRFVRRCLRHDRGQVQEFDSCPSKTVGKVSGKSDPPLTSKHQFVSASSRRLAKRKAGAEAPAQVLGLAIERTQHRPLQLTNHLCGSAAGTSSTSYSLCSAIRTKHPRRQGQDQAGTDACRRATCKLWRVSLAGADRMEGRARARLKMRTRRRTAIFGACTVIRRNGFTVAYAVVLPFAQTCIAPLRGGADAVLEAAFSAGASHVAPAHVT